MYSSTAIIFVQHFRHFASWLSLEHFVYWSAKANCLNGGRAKKLSGKEVFIMNILQAWSVLSRFCEESSGKEHLVELRLFSRGLDSEHDDAKKTL